jgi:hypothetical protein
VRRKSSVNCEKLRSTSHASRAGNADADGASGPSQSAESRDASTARAERVSKAPRAHDSDAAVGPVELVAPASVGGASVAVKMEKRRCAAGRRATAACGSTLAWTNSVSATTRARTISTATARAMPSSPWIRSSSPDGTPSSQARSRASPSRGKPSSRPSARARPSATGRHGSWSQGCQRARRHPADLGGENSGKIVLE